MKGLRAFILMICAGLLCVSDSFAKEEPSPPVKPSAGWFQLTDYYKDSQSPFLGSMSKQMTPGRFVWSTYQGYLEKNYHTLSFSGSMSTVDEPSLYGDPLSSDKFFSSVTYQYKGLFKGVIRPVARVSLGAGKAYYLPGGPGLRTGLDAVLITEAGIEIVIPVGGGHGVGFGVTAAYQVPIDSWTTMQDDKYTGGPFSPTDRFGSWGQWSANMYLIVE